MGIIRPFLTEKATTQLVCTRILNRLDYWNSLLAGTASEQMCRIQSVQDGATKLILKNLHRLPIKQRIDFKIVTLAYRHFNITLSSYLSARRTSYTPSRSLRSCSAQLLSAPRVNLKTAGERSFQFQASRVCSSPSCPVFLGLLLCACVEVGKGEEV